MSGRRLHLRLAIAAITIFSLPALASATTASAASKPDVPSGSVPGIASLDAVACATATSCIAVGSDDSLNGKTAVINAATGAAKAGKGTLTNGALNAVACPSKASCLAVADDAVAAVKAANGAMKVTATPKRPKDGIVALGAIACAGTKTCYAVGFEGTEVSSKAIVVRLSAAGKLLAVMTDKGRGIAAISCPSSSRCLISDYVSGRESIQLLTGNRFSTSHVMPANTYVQDLSCYASKICYALGGNNKVVPSKTDELFPVNPKTGAIGKAVTLHGFDGVSLTCATASRCLVVGLTGTGATAKPAVVVVNKGKPGPPKHYPGSSLHAVACASSKLCYAVGVGTTDAIVDKI